MGRHGSTAGWLLGLALAAQAGAQSPARPPTLEERVTALEKQFARLDTRTGIRESLGGPTSDTTALAGRVSALENTLNRLAIDLQRIERQADSAAREASQARTEAMSAQQAARDAQMRVR